ncbi:cytochrome c biogenesis protein CcdA [Candidatus Hodarchaeum mangrovi]
MLFQGIISYEPSLGLFNFFFSGLYVALSPCLFPIMPLTVFRIMDKKIFDELGEEHLPSRKMALQWVLLITSGIVTTFAVSIIFLSLFQFTFSLFLINNYAYFSFFLGLILFILALFVLFPQLSEKTFAHIPIPQGINQFFNREEYKALDLFLLGLGYSFIAFPCAAPVFIGLFFVGVSIDFFSILVGMVLFAVGVAIPYLVLVMVTSEARNRVAQFLAEKFRIIEIIVGGLMIIVSLMLISPLVITWIMSL